MLPEFVNGRLKPWETKLPPCWHTWQYKSLNMHRGVIHWDATTERCTIVDIRDQFRHVAQFHYKPSWWRGFAFGAIVSLKHVDDSFQHAGELIDEYANGEGTWQWLVFHFPEAKIAIGVTTWIDGYLAPVYQDLMGQFKAAGYQCRSHVREMDAFLQTLVKIQKNGRILRQIAGLIG